MPKYRKKPIVVEAVKLTSPITIETMEGSVKGNRGDYLITEVSGEQYLCEPTVFEKTYEPVSAPIDAKFKSVLRKSLRKVKHKTKEIFLKG